MDTFVLRLFPVGGGEGPMLRGVVSRVASGHSVNFHSVDELVAFLVDPLRGEGIDEERAL
ncbi:MAG TPA: hypothetical protein VF082_09135 [Jiangellaceae bacterium]